MKHTTKMRSYNYPSSGICIYCLKEFSPEELTKEHIIPSALNGTLILLKAACDPCRDHTNKGFENAALQADFLVPRLLLELKRNHKKVIKKLPLADAETFDGERLLQIQLELSQYPPIVHFFVFPPPGILTKVERSGSLEALQFSIVCFPNVAQYKYQNVEVRHKTDFTAFALTLAKIGYCFAVAELGLSGFEGDGIRDLINNKRSDTFNFVGGPLTKSRAPDNQLHVLLLQQRGDYCTVIIHLFASFTAQTYEVVVGKGQLKHNMK
ncbi:MAG: HNH endonuclease [Gammaproteobacteria bacterium]|nr:MAG: HNH endonuclease [Gammaproteobacteria bacterium]